MQRSKSSKRWLQEHFNDSYVKRAQAEGYRSRAVYKLQEIDQKEHVFKPGMKIIDLGAAPGGWAQYASRRLGGDGLIIAVDLLPIEPLDRVTFIQGDFREKAVLDALKNALHGASVDVLLSDMAPNMSGTVAVDITRAMYLAELALDTSHELLKTGGTMILKLFHGSGFDALVKDVRRSFERVVIRKPAASRSRSRETYLLAKGYNL